MNFRGRRLVPLAGIELATFSLRIIAPSAVSHILYSFVILQHSVVAYQIPANPYLAYRFGKCNLPKTSGGKCYLSNAYQTTQKVSQLYPSSPFSPKSKLPNKPPKPHTFGLVLMVLQIWGGVRLKLVGVRFCWTLRNCATNFQWVALKICCRALAIFCLSLSALYACLALSLLRLRLQRRYCLGFIGLMGLIVGVWANS